VDRRIITHDISASGTVELQVALMRDRKVAPLGVYELSGIVGNLWCYPMGRGRVVFSRVVNDITSQLIDPWLVARPFCSNKWRALYACAYLGWLLSYKIL
jgi:hypothetical protein